MTVISVASGNFIVKSVEINTKIKKLIFKFKSLKIKLLMVFGISKQKIFPFCANDILYVS